MNGTTHLAASLVPQDTMVAILALLFSGAAGKHSIWPLVFSFFFFYYDAHSQLLLSYRFQSLGDVCCLLMHFSLK